MGMLGLADWAMWVLIVVVVFAVLGGIMFACYASQKPGGLSYETFVDFWYDALYFFFAPRFGEV